MTRGMLLAWIGYVVLVVAAVVGIVEARRRSLTALSTPEAQAEWQDWRDETVRQSQGNGPMKRRPAKAAEPPLLILLRDHFTTVVTSAIVSVTLFYWFLAFLIRGSRATSSSRT